ncbi:hypothetical protein PSTT_08980 [Puccinia striiformis]|uniref:Hydrophobin n=1 Tax=Puccinia striiformis TaxID=27350 RepID=A0A2S4VAA2_9BASI|nr:hypothetical protein PSTT_08980 [Puccinia striiformis]
MLSIKFLSVLVVIILQSQAVHSRRRSRDSSDKGTSSSRPFQCLNSLKPLCIILPSSVQVPYQNGPMSDCNRLPAKCCNSELKYDVRCVFSINHWLSPNAIQAHVSQSDFTLPTEEKSKPAGIGSAPITGGSISGSCSEPVF